MASPAESSQSQRPKSATRSRKGCKECRRRHRKCDERRPKCGLCQSYKRDCQYTLELNWGGREFKKSRFGRCFADQDSEAPQRIYSDNKDFVYGTKLALFDSTPRELANGIEIPPIYRRLLHYFVKDILPSISCDASIHQELSSVLVPRMLGLPHLLSAALTWAAVGYAARGLTELNGRNIVNVVEHLRTSSLAMLRGALVEQQHDEYTLASSLLLCMADLYAGQGGTESWRVHLKGAEAFLIDDDGRGVRKTASEPTTRFFHPLYLALRALVNVAYTQNVQQVLMPIQAVALAPAPNSKINSFLGIQVEVLELLQQIDLLAKARKDASISTNDMDPEMLRKRVEDIIRRDDPGWPTNPSPPAAAAQSSSGQTTLISSSELDRNAMFCYRAFQHATLIQLYRRLYDLPSTSTLIQSAVETVVESIGCMTQGRSCTSFVVTLMPLFTAGCEAQSLRQKNFIIDQMNRLEACLGSRHVGNAREAMKRVWDLREKNGDKYGNLEALDILHENGYNLVLF